MDTSPETVDADVVPVPTHVEIVMLAAKHDFGWRLFDMWDDRESRMLALRKDGYKDFRIVKIRLPI